MNFAARRYRLDAGPALRKKVRASPADSERRHASTFRDYDGLTVLPLSSFLAAAAGLCRSLPKHSHRRLMPTPHQFVKTRLACLYRFSQFYRSLFYYPLLVRLHPA